MEKAFHHKKTGVTFPICLGKHSVHNFSHNVNMAATLNITLWKCQWNGTQAHIYKTTLSNVYVALTTIGSDFTFSLISFFLNMSPGGTYKEGNVCLDTCDTRLLASCNYSRPLCQLDNWQI